MPKLNLEYLKDYLWLSELELALLPLEDIRTDCTEMTMIVSEMLFRNGVPHRCMKGVVQHVPTGNFVVPHFWIELTPEIMIDLRLRMWLGDEDDVPHGIFDKSLEAGCVVYKGEETEFKRLSDAELCIVSEGWFNRLRLPPVMEVRDNKGAVC